MGADPNSEPRQHIRCISLIYIYIYIYRERGERERRERERERERERAYGRKITRSS